MTNHEQLANEADELFDSLSEEDRQRFSFRWSYVGNREQGDVLRRLGRLETVFYGTILVGILGLLIARGLGG